MATRDWLDLRDHGIDRDLGPIPGLDEIPGFHIGSVHRVDVYIYPKCPDQDHVEILMRRPVKDIIIRDQEMLELFWRRGVKTHIGGRHLKAVD